MGHIFCFRAVIVGTNAVEKFGLCGPQNRDMHNLDVWYYINAEKMVRLHICVSCIYYCRCIIPSPHSVRRLSLTDSDTILILHPCLCIFFRFKKKNYGSTVSDAKTILLCLVDV